jgi:hypothetical protein
MPKCRLHYFPESGNRFPSDETGYDFAASHPAVDAWLQRIAKLPDWQAVYPANA